jgi:hypothetical protein
MTYIKKEPKLTYALDKSGKMVCINNVERGLSCNCRCPKCKEPLIAKHGNGGRQAHFAHRKESDCQGSYMTALHRLAEQILEEEKAVMVPEYKEIGKQRLLFEKVEVEQRVERKDLQPDIVGVTEDGKRWFIEILNTHKIDEAKREKIIDSNITCLEIDVSEQKLEDLKSFLLESVDNREWINNPYYETQLADAKRESVSQVENLIVNDRKLMIPAYADYDSKIISLKDVIVLYKSEDGLFEIVKAVSSDGIPYIFNIINQEIQEIADELRQEIECNILNIITSKFPQETEITLNALNVQWLYHYVTEKEQEAKLNEYRFNPKYEVKPLLDCLWGCEYKPINGECVYKKETITHKGNGYVVCNIQKKRDDKKEIKHIIVKSQIKDDQPFSPPFKAITKSTLAKGSVLPKPLTSMAESNKIDELYLQLSSKKGMHFINSKGEDIEILSCGQAKKSCGIIVLFKKNCAENYYIYGVTCIDDRLIYVWIDDYMDKRYAENRFKYLLSNWYEYQEFELSDNPFEGMIFQSNATDDTIFHENPDPVPF